jgi:hypothetical protein
VSPAGKPARFNRKASAVQPESQRGSTVKPDGPHHWQDSEAAGAQLERRVDAAVRSPPGGLQAEPTEGHGGVEGPARRGPRTASDDDGKGQRAAERTGQSSSVIAAHGPGPG